ncbi:MAG: 4Fe-4S dicluster domain-containing protein [Planctomycetota bacterium]
MKFKLQLPEEEKRFACFQCGKCVSVCPVAKRSNKFNPRQIVLSSLTGNINTLISKDSPIWLCTSCFTCSEYCPQDVNPIGTIYLLKNLAMRKGTAPEVVSLLMESVIKSGFSTAVSDSVNSRRRRLGLTDIQQPPIEDLKKIASHFPQPLVPTDAKKENS